MRNLKRVLTMIMAVAMMMSLIVVGAGATKFTDDKDIVNKKAVEQMSSLNIINGYTDGSFKPTANITRAEAVKMIVIALNGGNDPKLDSTYVASSTFTDCKGHWAEGYIEYAVNFGFVQGRGGQIFEPDANVTGTELAKMCLVALGYKSDIEKFANNAEWALNINRVAQSKNLYDGIQGINANVAINRDNAAQMIANFVKAPMVKYEFAGLTGNTNTGLASQQQAVDIIISGAAGNTSAVYQTVLNKYYKLVEFIGVMYAVSYDSKKNEYGYTIVDENGTETTMWSATDYSALIGQNVNAMFCNKDNNVDANNRPIYNRGTDSVYDIIAKDSVVVAEGVMTDFGKYDIKGNSLKFGDETYKVAASEKITGSINGIQGMYAYNNNAGIYMTDSGSSNTAEIWNFGTPDTLSAHPFNVKLIDNNDDGKIDFFVVIPFSIQKVTYVGSETVSFVGQGTAQNSAGSIKVNDLNSYDGIKADDIVAYYKANATTKDMQTVTKLETKTGKITEIREEAKEVKIDGNWYDNMSDSTLKAGDTISYVAVGSYIYFAKVTEAEPYSRTVLAIYDKAVDPSIYGGKISYKAKAIFGIDGDKKEINVTKVNGQKVTDLSNIELGGMYTYKLDGSDYELTIVGDNNTAGHKSYATGIGYKDEKIANRALDKNAVILVVDTLGRDAKRFFGAEFMNNYSNTEFAGSSSVLLDEINTFDYVTLATIKADKLPEINSGAKYGFLVSTGSTSTDNGETYRNFTVWNGKEEVTYTEKSAGSITPFVKGDIITYNLTGSKKGETEIAKDVELAQVVTGRVTGVDRGMNKVALDNKDYKLDTDTTILNVYSHDKQYDKGDVILKAQDKNNWNNCYYLVNSATDKVKLIVQELDTDKGILERGKTYISTAQIAADSGIVKEAFKTATEVVVTGDYSPTSAALAEVPQHKTLTVKGNMTAPAGFTVQANATLNTDGNLALPTKSLEGVEVKGTVNVGGDFTATTTGAASAQNVLSVATAASINVKGAANMDAVDVYGTLNVKGDNGMATTALMQVRGNGTVTVDATALCVGLNVESSAAFNAGELAVTAASVVNGKLTVAGELTANAAITGNGTVTADGIVNYNNVRTTNVVITGKVLSAITLYGKDATAEEAAVKANYTNYRFMNNVEAAVNFATPTAGNMTLTNVYFEKGIIVATVLANPKDGVIVEMKLESRDAAVADTWYQTTGQAQTDAGNDGLESIVIAAGSAVPANTYLYGTLGFSDVDLDNADQAGWFKQ